VKIQFRVRVGCLGRVWWVQQCTVHSAELTACFLLGPLQGVWQHQVSMSPQHTPDKLANKVHTFCIQSTLKLCLRLTDACTCCT
jgi:hypothetical protein